MADLKGERGDGAAVDAGNARHGANSDAVEKATTSKKSCFNSSASSSIRISWCCRDSDHGGARRAAVIRAEIE
jgi:hypothetical protein